MRDPYEENVAECPKCGVEYYGALPARGELSRSTICSKCTEWFVVFDVESDD